VIRHDGQGACLFTKRLERGRFIVSANSPSDMGKTGGQGHTIIGAGAFGEPEPCPSTAPSANGPARPGPADRAADQPLAAATNQPVKFARFDAMRSDMVEIVIGDVVVRAGSDVEADRLADVIRAVRKA